MAVNNQKPAPRIRGGLGPTELSVHSIFYTIQGEGPLAGRPAVFVRLYGCNLQCPGCDTDYTSHEDLFDPYALAKKVNDEYLAPGTPLVVITGGEPFRQPIAHFIKWLQSFCCDVQIETNGTLPLPKLHEDDMGWVDWHRVQIICSPKTGTVNPKLKRFITAYKYIVKAGDVSTVDGLPLHALDHPAAPVLARPRENIPRKRIYVQPMDPDPEGANVAACIDACYRFGYTLSLQQHKIIGVP